MHVPAGAIPKDGPSAGVTMVTALASLLTGRPVKSTVGMTGEVTLQGRVLPIGGLKQKVLAAHAAGLTEVILPERNAPDLDDVPADVREQMRVPSGRSVDEVLALALEPTRWRWPPSPREQGKPGAGRGFFRVGRAMDPGAKTDVPRRRRRHERCSGAGRLLEGSPWLRCFSPSCSRSQPCIGSPAAAGWRHGGRRRPISALDMAGDRLISNPSYQTTLAITIAADPMDVWAWLVQMGYRAAGSTATTGSIASSASWTGRARPRCSPSSST